VSRLQQLVRQPSLQRLDERSDLLLPEVRPSLTPEVQTGAGLAKCATVALVERKWRYQCAICRLLNRDRRRNTPSISTRAQGSPARAPYRIIPSCRAWSRIESPRACEHGWPGTCGRVEADFSLKAAPTMELFRLSRRHSPGSTENCHEARNHPSRHSHVASPD
jgi:hypothetical protein